MAVVSMLHAFVAIATLRMLPAASECIKIQVPTSADGRLGKTLANHTQGEAEVPSYVICGKECLARRRCRSFNFLPSRQLCQLNDVTAVEYPDDLVTSLFPDDLHYPINNWPELLQMQCAHHTCAIEERCIATHLGPICRRDSLLPPPSQTDPPTTAPPETTVLTTVVTEDRSTETTSVSISTAPPTTTPCVNILSCIDCSPNREHNGLLFRPHGCYKSSPDVLPHYVVNLRPAIIWQDLSKTINACAQAASSQGYGLFGIEFYGECYAGNATELVSPLVPVAVESCDANCILDVGGTSVMFVFEFY